MTVQLKLTVNDTPIPCDYFVESFIDHVVSGIIESLEGTGKITDLKLTIDGDKTTINLNGNALAINAFVNRITRGTISGMLLTLKGVSDTRKVSIEIHK